MAPGGMDAMIPGGDCMKGIGMSNDVTTPQKTILKQKVHQTTNGTDITTIPTSGLMTMFGVIQRIDGSDHLEGSTRLGGRRNG